MKVLNSEDSFDWRWRLFTAAQRHLKKSFACLLFGHWWEPYKNFPLPNWQHCRCCGTSRPTKGNPLDQKTYRLGNG